MRGRRQIEQLTMANERAQLAAEKTLRHYEREAAKNKEELQRLRQLRVAVDMGEGCDLSEAELRRLRNLGGSETQRDLASRVGVSQSTVSRHLRASHAAKQTQQTTRHGRKPKLTEQMLFAAARFQFLFGTTSLKHTVAFVQLTFGVSVSAKTLRWHLKEVAGFRLGDFRWFPKDRNADMAVSQRADYAETMSNKYGQNTLYEAIYYDEMKLTRKINRYVWSIGGWIPSVPDECCTDSPKHITLMYAASPSLGLVHYEIVEGAVTSDNVMHFMIAMVAAYTQNAGPTGTNVRAFIMDNARIHHTNNVTEFLHGEYGISDASLLAATRQFSSLSVGEPEEQKQQAEWLARITSKLGRGPTPSLLNRATSFLVKHGVDKTKALQILARSPSVSYCMLLL
ncbi:hypothetical protein BBJ28_00016482 [Nothophytophthora sp. Chile5]|nr:hypothetical protein BBJ28_00016482 [Nothophytophthora sp. Chile5]